jgi:hypothetical protein
MRPATLMLVAALAAPAGAAFAHAHLVTSVPAANATVRPAPKRLWLKFTEIIRPPSSAVRLTGPDGRRAKLPPLAWDPHDRFAVTVPLPANLQPGRYLVEWSALSPNAHHTQGTFAFTVGR